MIKLNYKEKQEFYEKVCCMRSELVSCAESAFAYAEKITAGTAAARDVLAERRRQVEAEDWTPEHDDGHPSGEIAAFAAVYAMPPAARDWPATETGYGDTFGAALCPVDWHPKFGDRRRELVKAGALILAEIERLDRAAECDVCAGTGTAFGKTCNCTKGTSHG